MKFFFPLALLAPFVVAADDMTICSKYTTALFGDNTGENQLELSTTLVNLAVLGDEMLGVPGILAPEGGLAPFFSGAIPTTNRGNQPVAINFLDAAADLPNPAPDSNLAVLLNHLYQFFGALLGCTAAGFPKYTGEVDMFRVHKFMSITQEMNDFFITQVGLAASALGVTDEDVTAVAGVLDSTFNTRCPPPIMQKSALPLFLEGTNPSICQDRSCPLDLKSMCEN